MYAPCRGEFFQSRKNCGFFGVSFLTSGAVSAYSVEITEAEISFVESGNEPAFRDRVQFSRLIFGAGFKLRYGDGTAACSGRTNFGL